MQLVAKKKQTFHHVACGSITFRSSPGWYNNRESCVAVPSAKKFDIMSRLERHRGKIRCVEHDFIVRETAQGRQMRNMRNWATSPLLTSTWHQRRTFYCFKHACDWLILILPFLCWLGPPLLSPAALVSMYFCIMERFKRLSKHANGGLICFVTSINS